MTTTLQLADDDVELSRRMVVSDEDALETIYRLYGGSMFRLASRVLRDDELAGDVVQDVFTAVWLRPGAYDASRGSLRSFLLSKTHSRSIDIVRSETSRRKREHRGARESVDLPPTIEEEVWQQALSEKVRSVLPMLPARERSAIEMAYFDGWTYRDVAERLGAPEGTVKSRIRSGLGRLQEALRQDGVFEF